jgi:DNA-binding NarL/FixJ family response regulator
VDSELRERLRSEINVVARMRVQLEELTGRVEFLEAHITPPVFSIAESRRQRRLAVMRCRAEGLSVALISRLLGLSRHTVDSILEGEGDPAGARTLGADGRYRPARRNGGPPA